MTKTPQLYIISGCNGAGIKNLFDIYLPIADEVSIFDNSNGKHELIAHKLIAHNIEIFNIQKFSELQQKI